MILYVLGNYRVGKKKKKPCQKNKEKIKVVEDINKKLNPSNNENIIKLPFNNPNEALDIALKIIDQKNYKKKIIDLRVANQVIISNGT